MVECGRCKQWISGDSLGLDREKMKKINFTCRACVEGERWEQEAREGKKKAMDGQISKEGEKTGNMRMEKRDGEKNGRVGKKSTKVGRE